MLRVVRSEVDSSRRRFSPHFRLDTIPSTYALVAYPPHLKFSNNTCRYDGERLASRQSDVYTAVAGSPEILVACSESCRLRIDCRSLFPARFIYFLRYALVARRGCRPGALFVIVIIIAQKKIVSEPITNFWSKGCLAVIVWKNKGLLYGKI